MVDLNKEMLAMLVDQNNPQWIEFHFYAKHSFCCMAAGHVSENHLSF